VINRVPVTSQASLSLYGKKGKRKEGEEGGRAYLQIPMHHLGLVVAKRQSTQQRPNHVSRLLLIVGRLGHYPFKELATLAEFHDEVNVGVGGGVEEIVDLDDAVVFEGLEDGYFLLFGGREKMSD